MTDNIVRAVDSEGRIRIIAADTRYLVDTARQMHNTSPTATAALGRTLTGALLMSVTMKNDKDRLTINIKGDGPIGRIVVSAKGNGEVKGYVNHPEADLPLRERDGKLDVGGLVGQGTLTVVMDQGLKEPYVGKTQLISGEIAEDLAAYFYQSDQIPSVVSLGVLVDVDYSVKQAGGFLLQLMPGADEALIEKVEHSISGLKAVTTMLDEGMTPKDIIAKVMEGFDVKYLEETTASYQCDCSREKVTDSLLSLGRDELQAILEEDGQAEVVCHFCNTKYHFDAPALQSMLEHISDTQDN
ncbi:Hsp33 family molecular chaperone HslO [Peptoniphilus equinus]|uniref:33 kDa chaperonin n=1 Tax=Peptoniphilus equinus TaxID=3016343 RepID=A0ABY7QUA1_9FIRM|nr:Hsp33 family molecular chaperone HslO [Peptoniphilus equinus]WBW49600.1 Hsp33 family molecular chaperone HslO [Peptoniphilus equinus]